MDIQMTRLYQAAKELKGIDGQSNIARMLGTSPQTVKNWEIRGISKQGLVKAQEVLGVSATWLETGQGNMSMFVPSKETPKSELSDIGEASNFYVWNRFSDLSKDDWALLSFYRDTKISAGNGTVHSKDNNNYKLAFSKATLKRYHIKPENAVCITVVGNSMYPMLPENATVGIHTQDTDIRDGQIYAIKYKGLLRVKFLILVSDKEVRIQSFNPDKNSYPDEIVPLSDVQVIGRVFWWSVLV